MHRTKEQWLALFAEQAQSGLTQTEFAKRQGIIPTYFRAICILGLEFIYSNPRMQIAQITSSDIQI